MNRPYPPFPPHGPYPYPGTMAFELMALLPVITWLGKVVRKESKTFCYKMHSLGKKHGLQNKLMV